jgi:hypothetical protein
MRKILSGVWYLFVGLVPVAVLVFLVYHWHHFVTSRVEGDIALFYAYVVPIVGAMILAGIGALGKYLWEGEYGHGGIKAGLVDLKQDVVREIRDRNARNERAKNQDGQVSITVDTRGRVSRA